MIGVWGVLAAFAAGCADDRVDLGRGADTTTASPDTASTTEDPAVADSATTTAPDTTTPDVPSGEPTDPYIVVDEGDEVIPQTQLHLDALWPAADDVEAYTWRVSQPIGSVSKFKPSASVRAPTFEANVAGAYDFEVTMRRSGGATTTTRFMVFVVPEELIHIELLWSTPGDPDESDEGPTAGADLDLHLADPRQATPERDLTGDGEPDPWFQVPADCFWFNAAPEWGEPEIADDPSLDRDDTDGAGPENINAPVIAEDACIEVGVHYWEDRGFGPSDATVRVYIAGQLVFEMADVRLVASDLWHVTSICASHAVDPASPPEPIRVCQDSRERCDDDDACPGSTCGLDIVPVDGDQALDSGVGSP